LYPLIWPIATKIPRITKNEVQRVLLSRRALGISQYKACCESRWLNNAFGLYMAVIAEKIGGSIIPGQQNNIHESLRFLKSSLSREILTAINCSEVSRGN
jgi:hypothetical protein